MRLIYGTLYAARYFISIENVHLLYCVSREFVQLVLLKSSIEISETTSNAHNE